MITLEEWNKLINLKNKVEDFVDYLYKVHIDLAESPLYTSYGYMLDMVVKAYAKPDFIDLVNWWLYEDVDKVINIEGTNIDVSSPEDFYNCIKNNGGWND